MLECEDVMLQLLRSAVVSNVAKTTYCGYPPGRIPCGFGRNGACSSVGMRKQIEERAAEFARRVFELHQTVAARNGGTTPAGQLLAAATSTAANYRAAGRARSDKELVAKLGLTNEEVDETVYWLEFIAGTTLARDVDLTWFLSEAGELRSIIAKSYATARRNLERRQRKPNSAGSR